MEEFLKEITKEAGDKLFSSFKNKEELKSVRGTSKEVITKYDKEIDEFLIKEIKDNYPNHHLLTEESGKIEGEKDSEYLWIVDSLDGSGNFANKNPLFSVCVALMKGSNLILGATYAPFLNEFYFAKKGEGAYMNGDRIETSDIENKTESYLIYCEGSDQERKEVPPRFSKIYSGVKDIRKLGSAGLETAWVAGGRAEGYFTIQIDPWDVASGVLLIEEAGGKVTDFEGNPWKPERMNFLASNGKVHDELLSYV